MTTDEIRQRLESAHLVVEPFTHHESGMSFLGFTVHGVWPQWAALFAPASTAQAPADVPGDMWADLAKALDNSANDSRRFGEQANAEDKRGWQQWETAYRWLAGVARAQQALATKPDTVAVLRGTVRAAMPHLRDVVESHEEVSGIMTADQRRTTQWDTAAGSLRALLNALAAALQGQPTPQPATVAVPLPPDAPAELLEARCHLSAAIGRCAVGATALAGTRPGEELERKQAVYQWLRDIVAAALERRPNP